MISTPDLIDRLAADAPRIRRLRSPLWRAARWTLVAVAVLGLLFVIHGARPDLAERLTSPRFAIALAGSLVTGVLAAAGCFLGSLPDRSRYWLLLPVPSLIVWISTIGYGGLTDWVSVDPGDLQLDEAVGCFATLLAVSIPLSAVTFAMLRHVARLRPAALTITAGLGVAGITSAALSLFHQLDATIMVLIWNVGMMGLVVLVDYIVGRRILRRIAARIIAPEIASG